MSSQTSVLWREKSSLCTLRNFPISNSCLCHNAAMQIVREPSQFRCECVTGNIFGDILSDCAAMASGSLGIVAVGCRYVPVDRFGQRKGAVRTGLR